MPGTATMLPDPTGWRLMLQRLYPLWAPVGDELAVRAEPDILVGVAETAPGRGLQVAHRIRAVLADLNRGRGRGEPCFWSYTL